MSTGRITTEPCDQIHSHSDSNWHEIGMRAFILVVLESPTMVTIPIIAWRNVTKHVATFSYKKSQRSL